MQMICIKRQRFTLSRLHFTTTLQHTLHNLSTKTIAVGGTRHNLSPSRTTLQLLKLSRHSLTRWVFLLSMLTMNLQQNSQRRRHGTRGTKNRHCKPSRCDKIIWLCSASASKLKETTARVQGGNKDDRSCYCNKSVDQLTTNDTDCSRHSNYCMGHQSHLQKEKKSVNKTLSSSHGITLPCWDVQKRWQSDTRVPLWISECPLARPLHVSTLVPTSCQPNLHSFSTHFEGSGSLGTTVS